MEEGDDEAIIELLRKLFNKTITASEMEQLDRMGANLSEEETQRLVDIASASSGTPPGATGGELLWPPSNKYEFRTDDNGRLFKLNKQTGDGEPVMGKDNKQVVLEAKDAKITNLVKFTGTDGHIYSFDPNTGDVVLRLWQRGAEPPAPFEPGEVKDILDPKTGEILQRYVLDGAGKPIFLGPPEKKKQLELGVNSINRIGDTGMGQPVDLRGDPVGGPVPMSDWGTPVDFIDVPSLPGYVQGKNKYGVVVGQPFKRPIDEKNPLSEPFVESVRDASGNLRMVNYQWMQLPDGRTVKVDTQTGKVSGTEDQSIAGQYGRTITAQKLGYAAPPGRTAGATLFGVQPEPRPEDFSSMTKVGGSWFERGGPEDLADQQAVKANETYMIGEWAKANAGAPARARQAEAEEIRRRRAARASWYPARQR